MLGMDTSVLEIDPSEESRERLPLIYHQLVKNHSGCAQSSSAYVENSSPFLSPLPVHIEPINSMPPVGNHTFQSRAGATGTASMAMAILLF